MLLVKIVSVRDLVPCDEPGHSYTGLGRKDLKLEGINCSVEQFVSMFLDTKEGDNFCKITDGITDIGGSRLNLSEGQTLAVSYEDWIEFRLDRWERFAKSEIETMSAEAKYRLGILSSK